MAPLNVHFLASHEVFSQFHCELKSFITNLVGFPDRFKYQYGIDGVDHTLSGQLAL